MLKKNELKTEEKEILDVQGNREIILAKDIERHLVIQPSKRKTKCRTRHEVDMSMQKHW